MVMTIMQSSIELVVETLIKNLAELVIIGLFSIIAYYVKQLYNGWEERGNVVDQLDRLINGVEGNDHFEGLIEVIEGHDEELDDHHSKISELQMRQKHSRERRQELEKRLERLKEKKANRERLNKLEDKVND